MMRIGVTGGAGFIGLNFVMLALERGHEVVVADSFTYASNREALEALDSVEVRESDLRDAEQMDSFVDEVELVVHFAAESHNDSSLINPALFFETNVMGTLNLATAVARQNKRLHHVSTDEVFGDLPLDGYERFHTRSPYHPSSPYSASKASADHVVRAWIRSFGLKATISNCSNNYGPYQHVEKLIPASILSASKGLKPKVYGRGENVRDWIHVRDHVEGIWQVLEKGDLGETYLLGASCERTNLQVISKILESLGLPEDFVEFVEDRPGHDRRYAIDPSSASNIGWQPTRTNFESELELVVRWYLENGFN